MVVVGPYPDVDLPETPLTAYVLERASEFGDKPALIDGPTGRTIGEVVFVPRADDASEDDGWYLTLVHDQATGRSDLVLIT